MLLVFFVNFNDEVNLDEVHSLYKKYIPKLNFYNNLEKDWAATMLSLLNEVTTPYSVNINEDQQFLLTKDEWQNVVDEALVKHEVDSFHKFAFHPSFCSFIVSY